MVSLIKLHLERQNGKHCVYIVLDVFDAVFFPCPYLRGNVVKDGDFGVQLDVLGYLQVETPDNPPVSAHQDFQASTSFLQNSMLRRIVRRCNSTGMNPMYASDL